MIKLITKQESIDYRLEAAKLPDSVISDINQEIKRCIVRGETTNYIIARRIVTNEIQWEAVKKYLNDAGWIVQETRSQMEGNYVTIS